MKRVEVPSYPVQIFIAGSFQAAYDACREYCNEVGLCVTLVDTLYRFTGGMENGVTVGLINYPRFPAEPAEIWAKAEALAHRLREEMGQESFTIQAPDKTVWFSWRAEDTATGGETPQSQEGDSHE